MTRGAMKIDDTQDVQNTGEEQVEVGWRSGRVGDPLRLEWRIEDDW